jgi:iron complex outermembrane receptor protein
MLFLYDLPQPPFLTNKVYANAASAVNKGGEISIGATIVNDKKISWKSEGNISMLKNYITGLSGKFKTADLSLDRKHHYGYAEGAGLGNAYITQLEIGHPAGVFWIPEHAGIDATGRELYNNDDAAGKLIGSSIRYTDQDRVLIDPTPGFTWGITNSFAWSAFDLNFFLRGVQGQKIFANTLLNLEATVYLPGKNVTDRALANGFSEQPQPSTYWLRDGSFTRLENATLGYNFETIKSISRLRCYLTLTNIFTITSYEGIDPEVKTEGSQRYIDRNAYPKTKGIVLGLSVSFK